MDKLTPLEILRQAREKISKREHWIKFEFAHNAAGIGVECRDPEALCFCAVGAIHAAAKTSPVLAPPEVTAARDTLWRAIVRHYPMVNSVSHFNDHPARTHEQVLEMFDRAIQLAETA